MSLECPNCGCKVGNRVTDTRQITVGWGKAKKTVIRRRRVCRHCGLPFQTVETLEAEGQIGVPEVPPAEPEENPDDNPFL